MANKIVQLTDRNRQPVYPIAGAMAEDAIETEMMKDGAVTSDKIDWTTIASHFTAISTSEQTVSVPTGMSDRTRIGQWTNTTDRAIMVFIEANLEWEVNNTGLRELWLGSPSRRISHTMVPAAAGQRTGMSGSILYRLNPGEYIILEGRQNSGGDLNAMYRLSGYYF